MHAGSSTRYAGAPSRREPYVSANTDCKPTDKSKFEIALRNITLPFLGALPLLWA